MLQIVTVTSVNGGNLGQSSSWVQRLENLPHIYCLRPE